MPTHLSYILTPPWILEAPSRTLGAPNAHHTETLYSVIKMFRIFTFRSLTQHRPHAYTLILHSERIEAPPLTLITPRPWFKEFSPPLTRSTITHTNAREIRAGVWEEERSDEDWASVMGSPASRREVHTRWNVMTPRSRGTLTFPPHKRFAFSRQIFFK